MKGEIRHATWSIVVVAGILGFYGIKSYRDAANAIANTERQAVSSLRSQAGQQKQLLETEATKQKQSIRTTGAAEVAGIKDEGEQIEKDMLGWATTVI
jgi:hypothetical protein